MIIESNIYTGIYGLHIYGLHIYGLQYLRGVFSVNLKGTCSECPEFWNASEDARRREVLGRTMEEHERSSLKGERARKNQLVRVLTKNQEELRRTGRERAKIVEGW